MPALSPEKSLLVFAVLRKFRFIFTYNNIGDTGKSFNAWFPTLFIVPKYKYYNIGL